MKRRDVAEPQEASRLWEVQGYPTRLSSAVETHPNPPVLKPAEVATTRLASAVYKQRQKTDYRGFQFLEHQHTSKKPYTSEQEQTL